MQEFLVFLSAVSSEFGSARKALGASLRSRRSEIERDVGDPQVARGPFRR